MRVCISQWLLIGSLLAYRSGFAADETTADVHKRLTVTFHQADSNPDQTLSLPEFLAGRDNPAVAKRDFRMCDFDDDQLLSLDEFLTVPSVVEAKHRGPMPDSIIADLTEQIVTLLDATYDDWDREPNREIKTSGFLERLDGQIRRGSGGAILIDDQQIDPDRSGTITRAEARRYVEIGMGVRNSDGAILRMPNGEIVSFAIFLDADADCDTHLDEPEFKDARRHWPDVVADFTEVDQDRNGRISAVEWVAMNGRPVFDPVADFCQMDANLDARLDSAELLKGTPELRKHLANRIFPGFDWNGDGVLSLAEYRTTMLANPIAPWEKRLYDQDDDGSLNLREFMFDSHLRFAFLRMLYFRRLDRNGDQKLDDTEWDFRRKQPDEFFSLNEDGTDWKQLGKPEGSKSWRHPVMSPDGKWIAFDDSTYLMNDSRIFIMSSEGRDLKTLATGMMPSWLPDGKSVICTRRKMPSGLWRCDVTDPDRPLQCLVENAWGGQVSPDGKQFAFLSGQVIQLLDSESGPVKLAFEAAKSPYREIFGIVWSPDGKQLCFRGVTKENTQDLVTIDVTAKRPEMKVHDTAPHYISGNIAWHPKQARIAFSRYSRERKQTQLYEFDPTRDDPPKLMEGQDLTRNNTDVCWTPDGKRLIVISGDF